MENIQLGNHPNYQAGNDHAAGGAIVSPRKKDAVSPAAAPSPPDLGSIRHAAAAAAKAAAAGAGAGKASPLPIIEEHIGEGGDDSGAEDVEDVPDVEDIEEEEEGVLEEGDERFNEPGAEEEAEAEAVEDEFIDTKSELTAAAAAEAAADKKDDDEEAKRRHAL